ncbi:hypothetical protein FRC08_009907 [Ceratobasidium sp. 394]|nr:hypothetical protein FRC08_009907 [Ceratobasidium sp. 394]
MKRCKITVTGCIEYVSKCASSTSRPSLPLPILSSRRGLFVSPNATPTPYLARCLDLETQSDALPSLHVCLEERDGTLRTRALSREAIRLGSGREGNDGPTLAGDELRDGGEGGYISSSRPTSSPSPAPPPLPYPPAPTSQSSPSTDPQPHVIPSTCSMIPPTAAPSRTQPRRPPRHFRHHLHPRLCRHAPLQCPKHDPRRSIARRARNRVDIPCVPPRYLGRTTLREAGRRVQDKSASGAGADFGTSCVPPDEIPGECGELHPRHVPLDQAAVRCGRPMQAQAWWANERRGRVRGAPGQRGEGSRRGRKRARSRAVEVEVKVESAGKAEAETG